MILPAPVMNYGVQEYAEDAMPFGVKKCVHIQAHHAREPVGETSWLNDIAESNAHGFPHGIVAFLDLSADNARATMDEHLKFPRVKGIRQMLDWHPEKVQWRQAKHDAYYDNPTWHAGVDMLGKNGLSFDLQIHVPQMQASAEMVRQHSSTQFILNHAGFPADLSDGALQSWREGMAALARNDNIAVKISGFNMFHHDWNKELLKPLVEYTINTFKPNRCMFASNFPVDKVHADSYTQLMSAYKEIAVEMGLGEEDVRRLFSENATRIYRL